MSFVIPERHKAAFAKLAQLSRQQADRLVDVLTASQPVLAVETLAGDVADQTGLTTDDARTILRMLASLYLLLVQRDAKQEELVKGLRKAGESTLEIAAERPGIDWDTFEHTLLRVLALHESFGVSAKASEVTYSQERLLSVSDTRLFTEVRPVFQPDPEQPPVAASVIHTLRIGYYERDQAKEFFVGLDGPDLRALQEILRRAVAKEKTIRALVEKTGLRILDVNDEQSL